MKVGANIDLSGKELRPSKKQISLRGEGLSTRSAGKGGFAYLEASQMSEARELVKAYRDYRAGMRRLKKVGGWLVVLLRRYQKATTRQGTRRVGLSPQAQA